MVAVTVEGMAASRAGRESLHGAYAARQCPVRLFRDRDRFETASPTPPDAALQALFDQGHAFEAEVLGSLSDVFGDELVLIPRRGESSWDERVGATTASMENGARVIAGALLPDDVDGRRRSEVDLLWRVDRAGQRPVFRPVDIKNHRASQRMERKSQSDQVELVRNLDGSAQEGQWIPKRSAADCIQLAHYHRHLESLGFAEHEKKGEAVWGGIIDSRDMLVWFDLNSPAHSTVTPQIDDDGTVRFHKRSGKQRRTALERYDFEFAFRLDIADIADQRQSQQEPVPVRPVRIKECERCPWDQVCGTELAADDDVSLVNGVGFPEWSVHRHLDNPTAASIAALDLATARHLDAHGTALLEAYAWARTATPDSRTAGVVADQVAAQFPIAADLQQLCERTLAYDATPLKSAALVKQIENARSLRAGRPVLRQPVDIPRADIEIDFDLECLVNPAQVYLWGALVTHCVDNWPEPSGTYTSFAAFEPMTAEAEGLLVVDLWAWFQEQLNRAEQRGLSVRIYGYNLASTETSHLKRIAAAVAVPGLPTVDELEAFTDHPRYVDLFGYMKKKWISNQGHSLKVMAPAHGFEWSDTDPSGLNSIEWYNDAVENGNTEMIDRILAYNADDCRATVALRL